MIEARPRVEHNDPTKLVWIAGICIDWIENDGETTPAHLTSDMQQAFTIACSARGRVLPALEEEPQVVTEAQETNRRKLANLKWVQDT
eukprot:8870400-Alexandrium_andersonii.AAC.1